MNSCSWLVALAAASLFGCSSSDSTPAGAAGAGGSGGTTAAGDGSVSPGPSAECGSVRLTSYTASASGWCEYDRTLSILPASVQQGLTLAIAEPYNGASYGGAVGEACGECWEISTISDTRTVMVHDLCPIQGNPLCAGAHFHFDLSQESAQALHGGGLDEAQARRVPCPVTGNIHAQINDRNEWGYLRVAFVNHRIPIQTVEYRSASGTEWRSVQRSGGAWHVVEDNETFAKGRPGGVFRVTSAQGEVIETPNVLTYEIAKGSVFDLGGQLTDQKPAAGSACVFVPPATVYGDGYGGIDQVRWQINPWGSAKGSETTEGCFGDKGSCIRVDSLGQYSGFHIYYRQAFPTTTFAELSMRFKAVSGGGELVVAPSHEGDRCTETKVTVGAEWSQAVIDVTAACASLPAINAVTVDNPGATMVLLVDDVVFAK
ncbi:MAG: hypothetical protein HY898_09495 [Deltaproteobacteria bacterium]|nr:hypothetical protein [Deltaproteobacteria bacterium]